MAVARWLFPQGLDMRDRKAPLYRSVNTRTHGVRHGSGMKSKWERNTKKGLADDATMASMHSGQRHGHDYTPLFRFLLSRVGDDWNTTFSEAVSRLDRSEPIFWIVATDEASRKAYVRVGESSYFSGLFVDDDGKLALVAPELDESTLRPSCPCCTHTLNGKRFTQSYDPAIR